MEPQNTEPQPLEERLQSQARSVDLRQAVMAALTGKESRRWTISELVERLKNLGVSRLTRAGVTGALAELELELPDDQLRDLPQRLIGFDRCYEALCLDLRMLVDADGLGKWSTKHHGRVLPIVQRAQDRYPLVIFHGDVGTGKTATAEAAADRLAREMWKKRGFSSSARACAAPAPSGR